MSFSRIKPLYIKILSTQNENWAFHTGLVERKHGFYEHGVNWWLKPAAAALPAWATITNDWRPSKRFL